MTTSEEFKKMLYGPVVAITTPMKADLSLDVDAVSTYLRHGLSLGVVGSGRPSVPAEE